MIPAIGVNISVHYCGGDISSVSFGTNKVSKCLCGSKKMDKDCCKDKQLSFKAKYDQHKTSQITFKPLKPFATYQLAIPTYSISFQPLVVENTTYNDYYPPGKLKQPLYILHRVFRI